MSGRDPQPAEPRRLFAITTAPCRLCGGTGEQRWLQCEIRDYAQQGDMAAGVRDCWRCAGTGVVPALSITAEAAAADG